MTVAILILAAGESRRFYGRETGAVGGGNLPPTAVMKPAGGLGEQSGGMNAAPQGTSHGRGKYNFPAMKTMKPAGGLGTQTLGTNAAPQGAGTDAAPQGTSHGRGKYNFPAMKTMKPAGSLETQTLGTNAVPQGAGTNAAPQGAQGAGKVYEPLGQVGGAETGALRRGLEGLVRGLKSTEADIQLKIQPVIRQGDQDPLAEALAGFAGAGLAVLPAVVGGATRAQSVQAGLAGLAEHLSAACEEVWVHDAARPEVRTATVQQLRATFHSQDVAGVFPALPLHAALRRTDRELTPSADSAPRLAESVNRSRVVAALTPQVFRLSALVAAHQQAQTQELDPAATDDDAGLVAAAGGVVAVVPDTPDNVKLTTQEDLVRLRRPAFAGLRCGTGWDLHAFAPRTGESPPLKLGGLAFESEYVLQGHSDGDAVLHALCDAIFSALGEADLGARFPSSDPQYKNADSAQFVEAAQRALQMKGATICNVSITILADQPKIAPHRARLAARIAELLALAPRQVGITATTSDGLGACAQGAGLAAQAQVLLYLAPDGSDL